MRSFFEPKSVAVAGVSTDPNKLGSIIFANLLKNAEDGSLKASVYALNPAHDRIWDRPCYATLHSIPEIPELLIIAVPVSLTFDLVKEAAEAGVRAVTVVTSGYAEAGRGDLEKEIKAMAAKHGMRILGPNTIGLLDTWSGVDSLFLSSTKKLHDGSEVVSLLKPAKGNIAIITQSGHLGEMVSEELTASGIGIRALVGTGNQLDISVEDVIRYFADDAHTKVIAVYLEGVHDGRRFMRTAAYAVKKKPLVVFKTGRTEVGARAALTHTASLVGDYRIYQSAFSQSGIIEARDVQELVDYCISLSMLPRTAGKRLVIVTNAGGVGAIAADEAAKSGLEVEPLGKGSERRLRSEFRSASFISNAALRNPVDLTASVATDEFVKAAEFVLSIPSYDIALIIPTHQTPTIDYDIASKITQVVSKTKKPSCVCVMGRAELAGRIHREFMANGIPSFPNPERAVRALSVLPAYETLREEARAPINPRPKASRVLDRSHGALAQPEVSKLLRAYRIREPKSTIVRSSLDFRRLGRMGFPVACKLLATGLIHKTEVGGVALNVAGMKELVATFSCFKKLAADRDLQFDGVLVQEMVQDGVEVILGGTRDPTFGPTILFGTGGTYTELIRDYSLAIAPVTPGEAKAMVTKSRLGQVLKGYRGGPKVKSGELSGVISRFSRIMAENPSIEQMELNPLLATEKGMFAVDSRVILARV